MQDSANATVTIDSSAVTLTLNGGTFAGGGNTVTATAANGVATFSNLVIDAVGSYTLTASDGTLTIRHVRQLHHQPRLASGTGIRTATAG